MAEKNIKEKKSRKGAFAFGLIIVILAVIGTVFLVTFGIHQIQKLTADNSEKNEFETLLYPVVTLDTSVFDDVTGADMEDLICSSVLSLLTAEERTPYDFEFVEGEISGMGIPQETVEKAFHKLFGKEVNPVHQSVQCSTCIFTYQSSAKRYVIPITGYDPAYVPEIVKISKTSEGSVELITGYIAYGDWEKNEENDYVKPEPAKYRKITLRKQDGGYYISALQNTDAPK